MARLNVSSDDDDYHSAPEEGTLSWIFQENIGSGGFGVVKLFLNLNTKKRMVIKECRLMALSGDNLARWNQELDLLKRLDHRNIVKAQNLPTGLDYPAAGATPFICMEYCEGGDLRHVLRQPENCCGLPEDTIRQICSDVNFGIQFLHSEKVIHRDLKPENILIKEIAPGKVVYKLTDFGYAKSYDNSSLCTSMVGTLQYVAPEVLLTKPYNSSVDFWSFGIVVFECITGRRPFLHGDPTLIALTDVVSRKHSDVIHIYWGEGESPVYSTTLPLPHRLSNPMANRLTSWLQTALHFDPDMRGGRRVTTEDAPCLRNMEAILNTKVMNCICTSIGETHSYEVDEQETIESLKRRIQSDISVPSCDQYLVTPTGHMPQSRDLIGDFISENNLGTIYIFATTFDPSFKMMHDPTHAVSKLTVCGDETIKNRERRDIYGHVYFHIREYHFFFTRLNQAHKAFLWQINERCSEVKMLEQALLNTFNIVKALASFIEEMHSSDSGHLKSIHDRQQQVLPSSVVLKTLHSWQSSLSQLQQRTQELGQLTNEIAAVRKETETYLQLAEEMKETNTTNIQRVARYHDEFVLKSCDIYSAVKNNKGFLPAGERLQDVLLGAMADAQTIIERNFNGVSFSQCYVALGELCQSLSNNCEKLEATKEETKRINEQRTTDLWNLLQHDRRKISNPFSPMSSTDFKLGQPQRTHTSSAHSQSSSVYSTEDGRGSVEEEVALQESLWRFDRSVSQDENDKVMERNKGLLQRLNSIQTEVHSLTTGASNSYPLHKTHTH